MDIRRMEELFGPTIRELERDRNWVRMRHEKQTERLIQEMRERRNSKPNPFSSLFINILSPFIIVPVISVLFFIVVMIVCGIGALCG